MSNATMELSLLLGDVTRACARVERARIAFEREGRLDEAKALASVAELLGRSAKISDHVRIFHADATTI